MGVSWCTKPGGNTVHYFDRGMDRPCECGQRPFFQALQLMVEVVRRAVYSCRVEKAAPLTAAQLADEVRRFLRDDALDHLADTGYDVPAIADELHTLGLDPGTCGIRTLTGVIERHRKPGTGDD